ncbi:hypothetical protein PANT111_90232 [Pantoea brenneri]|uniref:Uncharacterized protein n=1 Tax=Pantoea brenneri TaxID=472694 RepID=A0AAX3JE18_9GAMM|nr:hypothetical protein PANT111_90232 [Pantoea brenneri]
MKPTRRPIFATFKIAINREECRLASLATARITDTLYVRFVVARLKAKRLAKDPKKCAAFNVLIKLALNDIVSHPLSVTATDTNTVRHGDGRDWNDE